MVAITHPLLTALSRDLHKSRINAVHARQGHFLRTQGHTSHHAVHTGALVLAVGLKVLPVLIDLPEEFTRSTFRLCTADTLGR